MKNLKFNSPPQKFVPYGNFLEVCLKNLLRPFFIVTRVVDFFQYGEKRIILILNKSL